MKLNAVLVIGLALASTIQSASGANEVIRVAKDGSGDFTNPIAALNSIYDASKSRRYLIDVAPGIYYLNGQQLQMKPFVSLRGSGREATIIQSFTQSDHINEDSAVVSLASNSSFSDLMVRNWGRNTETHSCGIAAFSVTDSYVDNVEVTLDQNSARMCGFSISRSTVYIDNVKVEVSNFAQSIGAFIDDSNVWFNNLKLRAFGEGSAGIQAQDSFLEVKSSDVFGWSVGISSFLGAAHIRQSRIRARGTTFHDRSYEATVISSQILALGENDVGINFSSNPDVKVLSSQITGAIENDPAGTQCGASFDGDMAPLSC